MDNNELSTNLAEVGTDCISREQAIDALERAKQNIRHNIERAIGRAICEILDEVENGIRQLSPANCSETPNNSDTISRQQAIDALYSVDEYNSRSVKAIKQLPPIRPKRGRWIYGEDSMADCVDGYRCDQCGFFVPWDYQHKSIDYIKDYDFCPKCGSYNGGEQYG